MVCTVCMTCMTTKHEVARCVGPAGRGKQHFFGGAAALFSVFLVVRGGTALLLEQMSGNLFSFFDTKLTTIHQSVPLLESLPPTNGRMNRQEPN